MLKPSHWNEFIYIFQQTYDELALLSTSEVYRNLKSDLPKLAQLENTLIHDMLYRLDAAGSFHSKIKNPGKKLQKITSGALSGACLLSVQGLLKGHVQSLSANGTRLVENLEYLIRALQEYKDSPARMAGELLAKFPYSKAYLQAMLREEA